MKNQSSNNYAIVSLYPKRLTDKTIFLFRKGRYWSEEDKIDCIEIFLTDQRLFVDEIQLNATLDECQSVKESDPYVDWNVFSKAPKSRTKRKEEVQASAKILTLRSMDPQDPGEFPDHLLGDAFCPLRMLYDLQPYRHLPDSVWSGSDTNDRTVLATQC